MDVQEETAQPLQQPLGLRTGDLITVGAYLSRISLITYQLQSLLSWPSKPICSLEFPHRWEVDWRDAEGSVAVGTSTVKVNKLKETLLIPAGLFIMLQLSEICILLLTRPQAEAGSWKPSVGGWGQGWPWLCLQQAKC